MQPKRERGASTTACRKRFGNGFLKNFASKLLGLKLMQARLRTIAVLLLGTIVAGLPGARTLAVPAVSAGHPAGCHSHGPATPTPAPPSYECCVSGHHAAIPNASFASRALGERVCSVAFAQQIRLDSAPALLSVMFVVPSYSPPGAVSLRI